MTLPMPRIKAELLQHLRDDVLCRLGVSTVHGIGVFAIRDIPQGREPFRCLLAREDVRFETEEFATLPEAVKQQIETFCYCKNGHAHIPVWGLNVMDYALYMNHSKV